MFSSWIAATYNTVSVASSFVGGAFSNKRSKIICSCVFFSLRKRQISLYFIFVSPWLNHCSDRLENLLQNPVLRSVKFCCCFWLFRYTCYKLLASYEQEMPLSLEFFSNYLRFYFSSLFGNENPFRLFIHAFLVHRQVRRFLCTTTFWLPSL